MKRKNLIWVIDDDPDQRSILKHFFSEKSYAIELWPNGKEAFKAFKKSRVRPSLILLDIMMPEMDGLTFLKHLRKLTKKEFIPVLMLTARGEMEDKITALKAGADDFITKPFDMGELEARVDVMLRIKRSEERIKKYSQKLHKANQLKEEMVSICSHDLRTPLVSIIMLADSLIAKRYGKMNESQIKTVDKMHTAADRAILLIRDLLDLGKLEQTGVKLDKDYFFLDPVLRQCIETMNIQAEKVSIHIQYRNGMNGVQAYGDARWIEQVVQNLLSNAIKFNRTGGRINVSLKPFKTKRRDDVARQVLVEVRDTGRGIAEKEVRQVFNKYVQLKKRDALMGNGLGLAICKKIIGHHHGNIWVKSKPRKGSTFFFTLPMR